MNIKQGYQAAMEERCFVTDGNGVSTEVRPEVVEFAGAMEAKLRKNDHKTHWRDKPVEALKRLMLLEVEEFKVAHEFFDAEEAAKELVDIANYALILRDRIRIDAQYKTTVRTGPISPVEHMR